MCPCEVWRKRASLLSSACLMPRCFFSARVAKQDVLIRFSNEGDVIADRCVCS